MRKRLASKKGRVALRYQYYEMKNGVRDYSSIIPAEFRWLVETLGWCSKAVDSLADRLCFREFREDNFDDGIYRLNNGDILFDSAVLSALISSCCFIFYISPDDDGFPRLQVIDGGMPQGSLTRSPACWKKGMRF